jgi:hypothetical protein
MVLVHLWHASQMLSCDSQQSKERTGTGNGGYFGRKPSHPEESEQKHSKSQYAILTHSQHDTCH